MSHQSRGGIERKGPKSSDFHRINIGNRGQFLGSPTRGSHHGAHPPCDKFFPVIGRREVAGVVEKVSGKDDACDSDASGMECKAGCISVADCVGVDDCIGVGKRGCDYNVSIRC